MAPPEIILSRKIRNPLIPNKFPFFTGILSHPNLKYLKTLSLLQIQNPNSFEKPNPSSKKIVSNTKVIATAKKDKSQCLSHMQQLVGDVDK